MERVAAGRPLQSIRGFSLRIGAAVGVGLLIEAAWYWFVLGGHSAPTNSAAYRDPLEAALVGALLLVLAGTSFAARSVGERGIRALLLYVAELLEFGLTALVTFGLTTLGLTTNLDGSGYSATTREIPLFSITFGLAFGAGLLMMLDAIAGRDSAGARPASTG